jgi:hypothetical protein
MAEQTQDYFGNVVQFSKFCGRYELPIFSKTYGIPQGRRLVANTDVDHFDQVHEWKFEKIREQLQDWYKTGIIDDEITKFYAWVGPTKYTVNTFEDFIGLSIDDLVLISRVGNRFSRLLKGQTLTPEILSALRDKLSAEVLQEIQKK